MLNSSKALGVSFTEWFPALGEETLALKILVAFRALEALTVVIVIKSFDPTVTGLNWETTTNAFGCEKIIPICFTIR